MNGEALGRISGQRFRVTREQPRVGVCWAGVAERMREQHARFESRQAVVVEGVADRWHDVWRAAFCFNPHSHWAHRDKMPKVDFWSFCY